MAKIINDFNGRKENCTFLWILCRSSIYHHLSHQHDKFYGDEVISLGETPLSYWRGKLPLCALIATFSRTDM